MVDAFFAAARDGDFDALVALLDPDVVLRADSGAGRPAASMVIRGAGRSPGRPAAASVMLVARASELHPALVNGAAGVVVTVRGGPSR